MKTCMNCIMGVLFGLVAASQAGAQAIVGAWTSTDTTREGSSVIVFLANGYFYNIENALAADAPTGFDGYERGTYTWNPATGALTINVLQDLNGDIGVGGLSAVPGVTITISGDTGTATIPGFGTDTITRVTGASPIVGAWSFGNAAVPDSSAVLVFLPNGVYFDAHDGPAGDPGGHDGIEHGTYVWNATTGVLTTSRSPAPFVDTNGDWGLSNPSGSPNFTVRVSADGLALTLTEGPDSYALSRVSAGASNATPANYQGLWWNAPAASEDGWGINFAHQGDTIFATWFTYDATGKGWWLVMSAAKSAANTYTGTLYQTHGPAFNAVPFAPKFTATPVGTGTLTFADAGNGTFAYTVNGISQTKTIIRQVFGPLPTCSYGTQPNLALATNYQDLWWNDPAASEDGWGINFTHQGDTIFATWFTYDLDGSPLWLVASAPKTAPGTYTGTLYRTTGPAFSAVPFAPKFVATAVGTATFTFADGNHASFAYTLTGIGPTSVSQTKQITRQLFTASGTTCQ